MQKMSKKVQEKSLFVRFEILNFRPLRFSVVGQVCPTYIYLFPTKCILTFGLRKENCGFDIFLNTNLYILLAIQLYFLMFILFNVLCIVPTIIVSNIAINP